jgi:hypothetical protein
MPTQATATRRQGYSMLEGVKERGDLIAAHRPTADSAYIEGIVQRTQSDGDGYFYEIAWEDGKHFGELFYEGELDEIDLAESEATIRVALGDFLTEDGLDQWLTAPNGKLLGLAPLEALETLGLKRTAAAAVSDYADALRDEELELESSEDDVLEDQLGDIFGDPKDR